MPLLTPTISKVYTPPTCTLEVTAQSSALSRWSRSPVIKSLQFLLSLDGLQRNTREPLELRGDQTQLSTLSTVVTDYIQQLLANSSTNLSLTPPPTPDTPPVPDDTPVQLRPQSLLTHELLLGNLATEQSGPSVVLKVSQLFDLATALEDCTADLQQLPAVATAPAPWRTTLLPLARSAAILAMTVGLGAVTWRWLQPGLIATKQTERSPTSNVAIAPVAPSLSPSPSNKILTSPPRPATKPLTLPSVQLPDRASNPFAMNRSRSAAKNDSGLFSSAKTKPSKSSAQRSNQTAQKLPSELSNQQTFSGEVAMSPKSETQSSTLESRSQADSAAAPSSTAGMGADRNSEPSQLSKSAPISPATSPAAKQPSLFDTVPQVAEVRDYVVSRWQPTPPPPKTLEYRVKIKTNGSLDNVEPLGASAQQYLNKIPLPSAQDPFVSRVGSGSTPNIRLVLHPDGTVQTFLDTVKP
jgi:Domain of unknown function (DUF4335)